MFFAAELKMFNSFFFFFKLVDIKVVVVAQSSLSVATYFIWTDQDENFKLTWAWRHTTRRP